MSDRLPQPIKYFNCIVIVPDVDGKPQGKKYHNIRNNNFTISKFLGFAKGKFPNATHVNFYNKVSKSFVERIYLE
jgi:hypothetical protein